MSYEPTWKERLEDARRFVGPALAVLIVGALGGWLIWWKFVRVPTRRAPESSAAAEAYARSLAASVRRDAATIAEAESEPLRRKVEVARTLALAAVTREEWPEALKAYNDARAAQAELNQRFAGTRYANPGALERFDVEIASLNAAELAARVTAQEREAETAAARGRNAEAGAALQAAMELQREINTKYPRSTQASAARADALAARRDALLAAPALGRVAALDREAALMLQGQQVTRANEKIAEAMALVVRTATEFPRSSGPDAALKQRLAFLAAKRDDLGAIQELVHPHLARAPWSATAQMLNTEVAQELYARVMDGSPSRHPGRARPVDSVNWLEAREFCQRLSWILGARVRLPREPEFRAAFGPDAPATVATGAWAVENSDGQSHETGKSPRTVGGFFDLLGNVAEWLEPAESNGNTAPVAGGSYLDSVDALRRVPMVVADKRERARHIGFRFVVEWPE